MAKYAFKNTPASRSKNMSRIKSKNTKPELFLRRKLWQAGIRGYRINKKDIDGTPDIVFIRKKLAVFVDGEFWHGKNWQSRKQKLKTNRDYWIPKIEKNILRDEAVNVKLLYKGWTVLRFWDSEIMKTPDECVREIKETLTKL